jgi:hypothetical protein
MPWICPFAERPVASLSALTSRRAKDRPSRGHTRDGARRRHADGHLLKTWIFESSPQPSMPCGVRHVLEIQLMANE